MIKNNIFQYLIAAIFMLACVSFLTLSCVTQQPAQHGLDGIMDSHNRVNFLLQSKVDQLTKQLQETRADLVAERAKSKTNTPVILPNLSPSPAPPAPPAPAPISSHSSSSSSTSSSSVLYGSLQKVISDYEQLHRDILAGKNGVRRQFVVARPQAQLNNRLRVIISALVFGMLTQRAVLVSFDDGYYAQLSDLFDTPINIDIKHFDPNTIGGGRAHLSFEDVNSLLCDDYNAKYASATVVDIMSPPNLIPFFYRNSYHQATLRSWFGGEEPIYRTIFQHFLKSNDAIMRLRDAFIQQNPTWTTTPYKLGIHIRWGPDHRPPIQEYEWNDMLSCVEAVIPKKYLENSLIYVAADTPESRERSKNVLSKQGRNVIFFNQWQRSNNPQGVQAAFVELLLLTECDNLVLSPQSSYSESAMALHGKPGYYIRSTVPNHAKITYSGLYEVVNNCMRVHTTQPSIHEFSEMIKHAQCYHHDMYTPFF